MARRQLARIVIEDLRGEERGLEGDDRFALCRGERLAACAWPVVALFD